MRAGILTAEAPLKTIALHSGAGAAALWFAVLWQQAPKWAYGPICGDAGDLLGHCPLCFPAAALTVVSLVSAVRAVRAGRRA